MRAALLILLASACASTEPGSSVDAGGLDGGAGDAGSSHAEGLTGAFRVLLVAPDLATGTPGLTAIAGRVSDGPTPAQIAWETDEREGDCALVTPHVPFCSTSCGGSAACVADDTCQRYPTAKSAGTVRLTGLANAEGLAEVVMTPIANNYQEPNGLHLSYPPFAEGDELTLRSEGGELAPLALSTKGIAPLVVTSTSFSIRAGAPLALRWTASGHPGESRVAIKLDISHHGGTKGAIQCDTDDDGELTLSAAMITSLVNLGVAGFPTVLLTRSASAETDGSFGRVRFASVSEVEVPIALAGVRSCFSDDDCAGGETCQPDLTCK